VVEQRRVFEDPAALETRRAAELEWATTRFPELATYTTARQTEALTAELLAWAPPGKKIEIYDRRCRVGEVTRREEVLAGSQSREVVRAKESVSVSFDDISIGVRFEQFGCSHVEYERDAAGRWVVGGSGGLGCVNTFGHVLSRVERDAAWYDAAAVSLTIECSRKVAEVSTCGDGSARSCEQCEEWSPAAHSHEVNFGIGYQPSLRRVPASRACDAPCPPFDVPADVKRANEVLRDRVYFISSNPDPHPLVFRTSAACRSYRKIHRFDPDELDVWSAGAPWPKDLPPLILEDEEDQGAGGTLPSR
jgi:hypothetical protein